MSLTASDWEDLKLTPGFCVIEPAEPPGMVGVIALPERRREPQTYGFVVRMGPPEVADHDPGFKEGDWVIYEREHAQDFETYDRVDLSRVRHDNVAAVVTRD